MSTKLSPRVFLYEVGQSSPVLAPDGVVEDRIALPHIRDSAFGDGSHPTTRLCAGAVDLLCRQERPHSVLDVGTGTAVLARIARARGAQFVVGTDIDPEAIVSAKTHIALDSYPTEILISNALPHHWGPHFNLVVANILEGPLRELSSLLAGALAPGGALILSGFTRIQVPMLRLVFEGCGLTFINEAELDGWALLMFRRQK